MPQIKNALLRFRIIDRAIRNEYNPYPSKAKLREACEEALFGMSDGANICDSTIEKDMNAMRMDHDAPIKYSKKFGGYYYTDPNYSLDDIPLTGADLEAIQFATKTLNQFKDVGMFKQFSFAIDKIMDRVAVSKDIDIDSEQEYIQFDTPVSARGNDFLETLLASIKEKKLVYFDYESFQSEKRKARKVVPLLLKEYSNRWYLLTYDLVKEAITTYALDRMFDLEQGTEVYTDKIDFNSKQFFEHAVGITAAKGNPETVVFKTSVVAAKYLISQPLHKSQQVIKEGKNKVTFELKVFVTEELIRNMLSYGGSLEVVEPVFLRQEMIMRIKTMVENYA